MDRPSKQYKTWHANTTVKPIKLNPLAMRLRTTYRKTEISEEDDKVNCSKNMTGRITLGILVHY